MEIWKDIPGYEWEYQASDQGKIRSLDRNLSHSYWWHQQRKGKILTPVKRDDWYLNINLRKQTYRIHRIVYCTFNNLSLDYDGKNCVLHKNDIRNDNRLSNLFLWTYQDNARDMIKKWRWNKKWAKGERNWMSYLPDKQIEIFRRLHKLWLSFSQIAKVYELPKSTIRQIVNNKRRI